MKLMKRMRRRAWLMIAALAMLGLLAPASCGSMHSYWGVENDYYSDGYRPHGHGYHKPPKPPKPPKHKHKKHHRHHHDDD